MIDEEQTQTTEEAQGVAAVGETADAGEANQAAVDPLEQRLAELESKYQREIKRLEHGLGKSIGKLRQRNRALEEVISRLVPDPSSIQFKSDDERKAYESYAKPIIEDIKAKVSEIENAEKSEEVEALRAQMVHTTLQGLQQLPDAQEIALMYNRAIQNGAEYDLDDDILAFTAHYPALLRALYADPQQIPTLKRMPSSVKTATLVALMAQANAHNAPRATQRPKTNVLPAAPIGSSGTAIGDPETSLDGDAYLKWYRERRSKQKG